ncbi:MAG: SGNH/GDSL hydrolase family protein [Saccharofermentanales bacterium]
MNIGQKQLIAMMAGFLAVAVILGIWLVAGLLDNDVPETDTGPVKADEQTITYDPEGNAMTVSRDNFNLTGRFLIREEEGVIHYISVWTGAEIEFSFSGTEAWCYLSGQTDLGTLSGVYAGLYIDGADEPSGILEVTEAKWYKVAGDLKAGDHTVRIIKHSEAFGGRLDFSQIKVTAPGSFNKAPSLPALKLEIIGDSITAGYGNMADQASDHFNIKEENGYLAYGSILARRMDAQAHLLAWSGIGVLQNNDGRSINTMPKIYELTAPGVNRTSWDFTSYQPDIILVNLGTNDMASNAPPEDFKAAYIDFIALIRKNNPDAAIFCTMGAMGTRLVPSMEEAVESIQLAGDGKVISIPMPQQLASDGYGADGHPSLATHEKMADFLYEAITDYLRTSSNP